MTQSTHTFQAIPFRIGNGRYSVHIDDVQDFHESERVRLSKSTEAGAVGHLTRKGGTIPVYSLGARLGVTQTLSAGKVVIVLKGASGQHGFAVDAVDQPIDVPDTHYHGMTSIAGTGGFGAIQGVVVHDGKLWLHLDPRRLQGETEEARAAVPVPVRELPAGWRRRAESGSLFVFPLAAVAPSGHEVLFSVSGRQVMEIIEEETIVPVPASPRFVPGLVLWRGRPVPVIDLGEILGWQALPQEKRNILIVRAAGSMDVVAFAAAGMARTLSLPIQHRVLTGDEMELLSAELKAISTALVDVNGQTVSLLDVDYLFRVMPQGAVA